MIITDYTGQLIQTMQVWEEKFFKGTQKEPHWKGGRSAYELANFIINKNGATVITDLVSQVLGSKVVLQKAIPEWEIRFDNWGHGREHDLAIWGKVQDGSGEKSLFVGVEAKVDEPFGATVAEAYLQAKTKELNGTSTNAPKRIEDLLKRNFGEVNIYHFDLRYQLLYATAGTVGLENNPTAEIMVLLVLVFKTDLYNAVIGERNYNDYLKYLKHAKKDPLLIVNSNAHRINLGNHQLYSVYHTIDTKID